MHAPLPTPTKHDQKDLFEVTRPTNGMSSAALGNRQLAGEIQEPPVVVDSLEERSPERRILDEVGARLEEPERMVERLSRFFASTQCDPRLDRDAPCEHVAHLHA